MKRIILTTFISLVIEVSCFVSPAQAIDAAYEHSSYEKIEFSSDGSDIAGYLLKAKDDGKTAISILLPACGGLLIPKNGTIRHFYRDIASELTDAGISVFLVDSFTPRDEKEVCSLKPDERTVDFDTRRKDGFSAMSYLRTRKDIIKDKVFLLSYGANGNFDAMDKNSNSLYMPSEGYAGAALFYPHCGKASNNFVPSAPIQIFVGEEDTWNPPGECRELKKRLGVGSELVNLKIYPDTHHGFVLRIPPRTFYSHFGSAIVGGNPASAADAYQTTVDFFTKIMK